MKAVRSLARMAVVPIAALGVFVVPAVVGGADPVWKPLSPAPAPRQEVSYVAVGGYVYLAAGNSRSQSRYDPGTDQWAPVADLPAEFKGIDHVHGVAVGGRIAYVGGLEQWEYPFPVTGAVAIYDPETDAFAAGAEMPSPRAAGGVVAWNGKVIYAGGLGPDGAVARVDAYDPETDEWTRLADMPRPREHFHVAVVDDRLYAVGGRRTFEDEGGIEIEDIAAVDALDLPADDAGLATASWHPSVTSLPTPRGGLGVAAVGECIYTVGGEAESGGVEHVTGVTESYDTATGTWHALSPLWTPRHGIQAATIGKTIYVAGGGTKPFDYSPTDEHEALDVEEVEPCLDQGGEEPPQAQPGDAAPLGAASGDGPPLIRHLAVRPRRVLLRSGHPGRRGAEIVISLSRPGRVSLRLPRRFRFSRRLGAGRNVLPLPTHRGGRALPQGRYRLLARPHPPGGDANIAQAPFHVID
jgi:hypothetical protein